MLEFTKRFARRYRPATVEDVLGWSFGRVTHVQPSALGDWGQARWTLHDPAIFGPEKDYTCACGLYTNRPELTGARDVMVCHICGVKYTRADVRRNRFGHIELAALVRHPVGGSGDLNVVPVLPIGLRQSDAGRSVELIYARFLTAEDAATLNAIFQDLYNALIPMAELSDAWGRPEAPTFLKGLCLVPA